MLCVFFLSHGFVRAPIFYGSEKVQKKVSSWLIKEGLQMNYDVSCVRVSAQTK